MTSRLNQEVISRITPNPSTVEFTIFGSLLPSHLLCCAALSLRRWFPGSVTRSSPFRWPPSLPFPPFCVDKKRIEKTDRKNGSFVANPFWGIEPCFSVKYYMMLTLFKDSCRSEFPQISVRIRACGSLRVWRSRFAASASFLICWTMCLSSTVQRCVCSVDFKVTRTYHGWPIWSAPALGPSEECIGAAPLFCRILDALTAWRRRVLGACDRRGESIIGVERWSTNLQASPKGIVIGVEGFLGMIKSCFVVGVVSSLRQGVCTNTIIVSLFISILGMHPPNVLTF